ncbi:hypothetical protein FB446DRAFT_767205 [Lentinula raphanica]|nr:hypothetical protein FB446DRAFT_767205 [Lentinula raphanica]
MENVSGKSFIGIVDFSQEAKWLYLSHSVSDILGYEPEELRGTPSLDLVHPDEMERVRILHYETIKQDKAACLVYIRMKHKDSDKGYVLCGVSRTIVHNVTVGSVSFASSGSALHNASTAQEITVISPTPELEFRRWHDPSPMPKQLEVSFEDTSAEKTPFTYDPLPSQSFRTALILERFSIHCPVLYCSNSLLITATNVDGRPFFDFVAKKDEEIVRSWIDTVKGWGVNERGQPSDGGFGFAKFKLLPEGRDYLHGDRPAEIDPPNHRRGTSHPHVPSRSTQSRSARGQGADITRPSRRTTASSEGDSFLVDAIFSAHSDGIVVILRRAS